MGYLKPRFRAILNEAILDNVNEWTLTEKGVDILRNGVFLKDKNLFYWLEDRYRDCYIVLAPNLTFSDEYNCWTKEWHPVPKGSSSSSRSVPVVRVEERVLWSKVRWLEVKGSFSTMNLNLYTTYKVLFLVKLRNNFPKDGTLPVELSLVLPSVTRQEITHDTIQYSNQQADNSCELLAGKFYHTSSTMGTMYFSMKNTDATWKEGISVLGVCVKPSYYAPNTKDILNWDEFKIKHLLIN